MSDVVELGLRRDLKPAPASSPSSSPAPDQPATAPANGSALKGLSEAFLKLMADFAPDADDEDARAFAAEIKDYRDQIALSGHDQETRRLASAAVKACEQFFRKSRKYYDAREGELKEVIGILRETAKQLAGDNSNFQVEMASSTERFRGMAQLDDIRELKKRLSEEATTIQKLLESKQKRDDARVSELHKRVEALQKNLVEAEEQASLDPLTRVPNRGTFDRSLAKMVRQARTSKVPMTLAMIDIDHFKKINDTHGHPIGDRVILCVAQWVSAAVRHTDVVARYGGEEFAVILSDADLTAAETRFTSVLKQIAARSFEYEADGETRSVRFTVSCGLAQLSANENEQELVSRADQALYEAKRQGRNRVAAKKRSKLAGLFG